MTMNDKKKRIYEGFRDRLDNALARVEREKARLKGAARNASPGQQTNALLAGDEAFKLLCSQVGIRGIPPTPRQAGKMRRKRGLAYLWTEGEVDLVRMNMPGVKR